MNTDEHGAYSCLRLALERYGQVQNIAAEGADGGEIAPIWRSVLDAYAQKVDDAWAVWCQARKNAGETGQ